MGVSPFPAAKLIDIAQQVLVTPFPANLAIVFLYRNADGSDGVQHVCLLQQEKMSLVVSEFVDQAVGTMLIQLPLWGIALPRSQLLGSTR